MKENNEQQQSFQEETLQILLAKSIGIGRVSIADFQISS